MKSALPYIRDGLRSIGIMCLAFTVSLLLRSWSPSQSLVAMLFVLAVFLVSVVTEGYIWGMVAILNRMTR